MTHGYNIPYDPTLGPSPRELSLEERSLVDQLSSLGIDVNRVSTELAEGRLYEGRAYGGSPISDVFYACRNALKASPDSYPDSTFEYPYGNTVGVYESYVAGPILCMDCSADRYYWIDDTGKVKSELNARYTIVAVPYGDQQGNGIRQVVWQDRSGIPANALPVSGEYRDTFAVAPSRNFRPSDFVSRYGVRSSDNLIMVHRAFGSVEHDKPTLDDERAQEVIERTFTLGGNSIFHGDFMDPEGCRETFIRYIQQLGLNTDLNTAFRVAERVRDHANNRILGFLDSNPEREKWDTLAKLSQYLPSLEACLIAALNEQIGGEEVCETMNVDGQEIPMTTTRFKHIDALGNEHMLAFISTPTTPPRVLR